MANGVLAVIPARLGSTRLPRKILLDSTGKPLIQHVYESVAKADSLDQVIVATDSDEILDACKGFGAEAMMTSIDCQSGTDRVAEVAEAFPDFDLVLNVQGDEPEMSTELLNKLVHAMRESGCEMGTVAAPWDPILSFDNAGCVKVTVNRRGEALTFSRSPIPHLRDDVSTRRALGAAGLGSAHELYRRHVGVYAFQRAFLLEYASLEQTPLELAESLEQLRALEHGARIRVIDFDYQGMEINTPEDYAAFVEKHA